MNASRLVPIFVVVAATGCYFYNFYKPDVMLLDRSPRAPVATDSVRLLAQEPTETYKVIAMLTVAAVGIGSSGKLERLGYELREAAGKLGGNGVMIGPESVSESRKTQQLTGRVIVFDSVAPPVQAAARKPSNATAIVLTSATLALTAAGIVLQILAGPDTATP